MQCKLFTSNFTNLFKCHLNLKYLNIRIYFYYYYFYHNKNKYILINKNMYIINLYKYIIIFYNK